VIKTSYDPEADAFAARFAPAGVATAETREVAPGVMLDFDAEDNVSGVEVLSIRQRMAGAYHGTRERSRRPNDSGAPDS
jgi:uncharacterized protein YuzE